ncbi:MAG: hypothetical protein WDO19_13445 [Bacteroidota bacterium]
MKQKNIGKRISEISTTLELENAVTISLIVPVFAFAIVPDKIVDNVKSEKGFYTCDLLSSPALYFYNNRN